MKIGIIGTSRITSDHISVLKKLKHKIAFISSTRKKSLNLNKISRKYKIKKNSIIGVLLLIMQKNLKTAIF